MGSSPTSATPKVGGTLGPCLTVPVIRAKGR